MIYISFRAIRLFRGKNFYSKFLKDSVSFLILSIMFILSPYFSDLRRIGVLICNKAKARLLLRLMNESTVQRTVLDVPCPFFVNFQSNGQHTMKCAANSVDSFFSISLSSILQLVLKPA